MAPTKKAAAPVEEDGTRRLASLGLSLLVLLGSPILSLDVLEDGDGSTRIRGTRIEFSALEGASVAIIDVLPPLQPVAQALYFPAAFLKRSSKILRACYLRDAQGCNLQPLSDLPAIYAEADLTPLLAKFAKSFAPFYLSLMMAGCSVVTLGALFGLYRPVRAGVFGFLLIIYAGLQTDAVNFLPSLLMEAFLGIYVLFYDVAQGAPPKPKTGKARGSATSPKAAASTAAKGSASPAAGSAGKKKK